MPTGHLQKVVIFAKQKTVVLQCRYFAAGPALWECDLGSPVAHTGRAFCCPSLVPVRHQLLD